MPSDQQFESREVVAGILVVFTSIGFVASGQLNDGGVVLSWV
ncbi:hypothetical protein [Natrinema salaciae]|uniref:Uncharacterized protein n=1 Tax=Natrinema salaciae TaxID=1186196 RepID=A0A1H9S129_9EURY|nr:hypothetical protein [Natrinema salaciae]SER78697.1 hypothetical protein SAMN04489841_4540 [Natrinema salaciae]